MVVYICVTYKGNNSNCFELQSIHENFKANADADALATAITLCVLCKDELKNVKHASERRQ